MSALLVLHGFLGTPASWDRVFADGRSLDATGSVERVVLHGHGRTPDVSAASFDAVVAALAARIDRPAVVAGYSMGARLALALAIRHPARVRAAILVGGTPGLRDAEARRMRRAWDESQAAALERDGLPAFVDAWERLPLFATQSELPAELRAAERDRRLSHTAHGAAHAMRTLGLGVQPDFWPELATCRVPLAFLAGDRDEKLAEVAREAARAAHDGTAVVLPGAGHNLLLEAPAAVAAVIAGHGPFLPSTEESHA